MPDVCRNRRFEKRLLRARSGYCIGSSATVLLRPGLAAEPGLRLVSKGGRFPVSLNDPFLGDFGSFVESFELGYLETPALVRAGPPVSLPRSLRLHLVAGPVAA